MAWRYPREFKPKERERRLFADLKNAAGKRGFEEAEERVAERVNQEEAARLAIEKGDVHILVNELEEERRVRALRKMGEFKYMLAESEFEKKVKSLNKRFSGMRKVLAVEKLKREVKIGKLRDELLKPELEVKNVFLLNKKVLIITPKVVDYLKAVGEIRSESLKRLKLKAA